MIIHKALKQRTQYVVVRQVQTNIPCSRMTIVSQPMKRSDKNHVTLKVLPLLRKVANGIKGQPRTMVS